MDIQVLNNSLNSWVHKMNKLKLKELVQTPISINLNKYHFNELESSNKEKLLQKEYTSISFSFLRDILKIADFWNDNATNRSISRTV